MKNVVAAIVLSAVAVLPVQAIAGTVLRPQGTPMVLTPVAADRMTPARPRVQRRNALTAETGIAAGLAAAVVAGSVISIASNDNRSSPN